MINPEKVRLMHEISCFKTKEAENIETSSSFFKSDYVTKHMLGAFFAFSVSFLLIMAISILYNLTEIVGNVDYMAIVDYLKKYVGYYFVGLVIYEFITLLVYAVKYDRAVKDRRLYLSKLRRLDMKYDD